MKNPERSIEGFVTTLSTALPEAQGRADSSNTRRMKLSRVLAAIGLRRRSERALADLDVALKRARIYCDHPLVERSHRRDTLLRFSRAPFPPETMLFHNESALRDLVAAQIGNSGPLKSLVLLDEEVRIGNCRVDLLCEEPSRPGRPLVVVEFKKDAASDRLAGQLSRYVDTIRRQPEYADRPLKVIVITAGQDEAVQELMRVRNVDVECYRYAFKLIRVEGGHT